MHQPPIPHVASTDPEIAGLIEGEARRQFEKVRLIPSENYASVAVLEATGSVLDQQVLRGLSGPSLLRGPAVHRPDRDAGPAAGRSAVRRGPRQRAALLRLAGQPRRLPGVPPAGRHGHGDGAADGRAPHARLAGLGDRQVVPRGAVRGPGRHRPPRPGPGPGPGPGRTPQDHLLRRHRDPADHRLPGVRGDRGRDRGDPGRRHRAHRRADRGRGAPLAGGIRPGDHDDHAQDPPRPARRHDHVRRRVRVRAGQGGVPGPAGRPAQPHHGRLSRSRCTRRPSRHSGTTRARWWRTPRRSPRR